MSKDPAFLFYTGDFIAGIQDLTFEERGQYITLLCLQHQKGHLSDKLIKLSVGNAAADVMAKFRQDSAGLWFNARLDIEIEKRRAHGDKQKERALEGWKKRKAEEIERQKIESGNAAALPLEDENINRNENAFFNKKEPVSKLDLFEQIFTDEIFIDNLSMTHRGKDIKQAFEECYIHHSNAPNPPNELGEWKQKLNTWLTNTKNGKQITDKRTEHLTGLAADLAKRASERNSGR